MTKDERIEQLESALRSLQGCMADKIYIFGAYGDQWSECEPDPHEIDEYEVIDFRELLAEGAVR